MTMAMNKTMQDLQSLSPSEKGLIAQYLLFSLDSVQDSDAHDAWAKLTKIRYEELKSGKTTAVSWESIKNKLLDNQ
jgi:putative addiction module component (TIGR02574 family)